MSLSNEEKKNRIIQTAGLVFSQKGFHQARVDEIAEMAGVAKGTIYYNYQSKAKLFAATVTHGLNQITAAIEDELDSTDPFPGHFKRILAKTVNLYVTHGDVMRIYANEMSSGIDGEILAEIQAEREKFNQFIEAQIRAGQAGGYLKPMPARFCALAALGVIDSLCGHYLAHPEENALDEVVETVFGMLSTGLFHPRHSSE